MNLCCLPPPFLLLLCSPLLHLPLGGKTVSVLGALENNSIKDLGHRVHGKSVAMVTVTMATVTMIILT